MSWIFFTALSVIFRAIYGVMSKVLSSRLKVSAYTQATLLLLAGASIALIASPLLGGLNLDFSGVSLVAVLLVVFGQGFGNILYFSAIKNLTNSTTQIAFSSILFFNTFLSIVFLNLSLSFVNVIGLFLLMLAILSVVTGKIEIHRKGVAMIVLSAFLFSIFQLASSEISKQVGAATYLMISYLGAATVIFGFKWKIVLRDMSSEKKSSTVFVPLLTALPSVGNFLFAYYAYRSAPQPAKVAILLTSQVVLTVFLSYFFLKEKGHLTRKIFAAALVVVAAFLIKS